MTATHQGGVHRYFGNQEPLTEPTREDPFSEAGLRTLVRVRFSSEQA